MFIVGINSQIYPDQHFEFPVGRYKTKTVRDAIHGLPEPAFYEKNLTEADIPFHPNHWTMRPLSTKFNERRKNKGRSFRRLDWDEPSPTVAYGNREIHIHPRGHRRLSIYEAMLLQGFPKNYVLNGTLGEQVTQISNAVPPPVAKSIAKALTRQLSELN